MWKCASLECVRKICCFVYGKRSDVQRQQQVLNSCRTAEESRTILECTMLSSSSRLFQSIAVLTKKELLYCSDLASGTLLKDGKYIFLPFLCIYYDRQPMTTGSRDRVCHG